jgi:hypothetical protein
MKMTRTNVKMSFSLDHIEELCHTCKTKGAHIYGYGFGYTIFEFNENYYHENVALRKARSLLAFLIFNASNKPTFRNRA